MALTQNQKVLLFIGALVLLYMWKQGKLEMFETEKQACSEQWAKLVACRKANPHPQKCTGGVLTRYLTCATNFYKARQQAST